MPDDETLEKQPEQVEDVVDQDEEPDTDVDAEDAQPEGDEKSLEARLKQAVDVRVEDIGPLRKKLTITVPHDTISGQLDDQYGDLRRDALVPGFRKGRAPRRLLEKRFGSEVNETLVQQMVSTGYMVAIDKIDLKVIGDPLIWAREKDAEGETLMDVSKALDLIELPPDEPLVFSCEVEVRPEFELPELKGIAINKPVITVTNDDVTKQLDRFRAMRGHQETLADGVVEPDDVVIADLKMTSGGTVLKEQEAVRFSARPQVVDGVTLEKLGEVLAGARVGDTRKISGTVPDDYIKAEFRSQQVDLEIKVREIQRLHLPALDEAFVQGLGFDGLAELRDWIRRELESRLGEQVHRAMVAQAYQYLHDNTSFELPERFSERQTGRVVVHRMLELYRQGVPPAEAEKLLDELKTSAKAEATHDLKLSFVMDKLGEKFDVDVSEGEINGLIAAIAQRQGRRFDRVRDELTKEGGLAHLFVQIRDEKIMDQLIAQAQVTEKKPDADQADKTQDQAADSSATDQPESASKPARPKRKPPAKPKDQKANELADET